MKREIKFKLGFNGTGGIYWQILELDEIRLGRGAFNNKKPDYYLEYTGIKDREGKEIYEGDIIRINHKSKYTKKEYWFPLYHVVYETFGFTLKHCGGDKSGEWFLSLTNWELAKVIGNIYENPELIK